MRAMHDDGNYFTESQLPILVEKSLKYDLLAIKQCPICTRREEDFDGITAMQSHVAEELLILALEALPWDGGFLEASSGSQAGKSSSQVSNKVRANSNDQDLSIFESSDLDFSEPPEIKQDSAPWKATPLADLKLIHVSAKAQESRMPALTL